MLALFSVVAIIDVYSGNGGAGALEPRASWFNPFDMNFHDLLVAMLLGVFLYWGWDSGVAVNEESEDSSEGPGRAAVVSTLLLVVIYLLVSTAGTAYHGVHFFLGESEVAETHREDILHALGKGVLGSVGVKFLIIAVLTSAAASTQTTILPTARTTLSMAHWGAIPRIFGKVHPRFLTPTASTWGFGLISIAVAAPLILISSEVLELAVVALGIPVCFYYGTTGFASAVYYRKEIFQSTRKFFLVGLLPRARRPDHVRDRHLRDDLLRTRRKRRRQRVSRADAAAVAGRGGPGHRAGPGARLCAPPSPSSSRASGKPRHRASSI